MYYFIIAFALFAFLGFFYRIIFPQNEPHFRLLGVLSDENLRLSAMNLAAESKNYKERGKGLSVRLIQSKIKKAFRAISRKVESNQDCHDFEHWIYDNFYKLNDAILRQKKHLISYMRLPHIKDLPRIYSLAQLLVKATGGAFNRSLLKEVVDSYCAVTPLCFHEINSLKYIIEFCLLEYIAIFCSKSIVINSKVNKAKNDAKRSRINLSEINFNSYVYGMDSSLRYDRKQGFIEICQKNGLGLRARVDNFFRQVAGYAGYVQAAITNLHSLSLIDDEFIINLSPLNNLLSGEKKINYEKCTLSTKFVYLFRIDSIARRKRINELFLARQFIEKSIENECDIAHYILPKKASYLHMRLSIGVILAFTVIFSVLIPFLFFREIMFISIILFPIVFGLVMLVIREFLGVATKRRYLPRVEIEKNDCCENKTMILFSRLIADLEEVDDAFKHLETIKYANFENLFSYGVLIDFPSSNQSGFSDYENQMIARIKENYKKLEQRERYNIFVRKKQKVSGENRYQGWEKKRGALLNLNTLILNEDRDNFEIILGSSYKVKYVIALDSDTLLNSAKELVEVMEHPYNKDNNVLSLTIATNPTSVAQTTFSRFMSGGVGLSSYSDGASNPSFDIYGHGNYTGKGIYRVKEFHASVCDKFLDNRILSHDFIEGAMAGCANAAQKALDSFPPDFDSFFMREQRWLRGDWQLLPYIYGKIKNRQGRVIKNPISPIDKWHIFCNQIVSLIPIASLLVLIISVLFSSPLLLVFAFLVNLGCVINAFRVFSLKSPKSAVMEIFRQIYLIACLPVVAVNNAYSITLTLYRLMRRRRLLEWKVFAHSKGKINYYPNYITAVFIITFAIIFKLSVIYYIVLAVFILAPVVNRILSKKVVERKGIADQQDRETLLKIARKTWEFFERQFKAGFTLVCDNYQEYLDIGYARRTSPTNIGMSLVAICSAKELGFIGSEELEEYIGKIIDQVEKLEKWEGNLYNWIDLNTLEPLKPRYVSSVDSGNFLISLMLVRYYVRHSTKSRIDTLISNTHIDKLFDDKRGLFYIGYDDSSKSFDKNHYDLLSSEAILTYLAAIGLGKISKTAFNNLSHQHVKYQGNLLYSWSGGMFEYLMPTLFFHYPKRGMMDVTAKNVVRANMKYAKYLSHDFWGVSECQYNRIDSNGLYQYKAFGVPFISLKNLRPSLVFAPYASCIALPLSVASSLSNIKKMISVGMLGEQGFYESIDDGEIIKTYMAHHQGMVLASITNVLLDDVLLFKMKNNPEVRAAELLLTKPNDVPNAKRKIIPKIKPYTTSQSSEYISNNYVLPKLNLLSGGKYNLLIDQFGNSRSIFENYYITRPDAFTGLNLSIDILDNVEPSKKINLLDVHDSHSDELIKRGGRSSKKMNLLDGLKTVHNSHSSEFSKCENGLSSLVTAFCLPSVNGEVRSIKIKNISSQKISFTLNSFVEIALASKDDYLSHKAYSNLFLFSEYQTDGDFLLISRRKKHSPYFAHYFSDLKIKSSAAKTTVKQKSSISYTANKAKFFRNNDGQDFGLNRDTVASGSMFVSLDPLDELSVNVFNIVSFDLDYLKRQVSITRSEGYFKRILGECFSISRQLNPVASLRDAASKLIFAPKPPKRELAQLGVNLDCPVVVFHADVNSFESLRQNLNSIKKLYKFDISFNLIILYSEKNGYFRKIFDEINSLLSSSEIYAHKTNKSTVIPVNSSQISRLLLQSINESSIEINLTDNPQLPLAQPSNAKDSKFKSYSITNTDSCDAVAFRLPSLDFKLKLGIGGFLNDGSYALDISNIDTPLAWSNVIANENFGTIVTESGGGFTYSINSRENKITSFSNDSIEDFPSESIIIQEDDRVFSITKKPIQAQCEYRVVHSFGFSEFTTAAHDLVCNLKQYISGNTKFFDITIANTKDNKRNLSVAAIFEVVLGTNIQATLPHLEFSTNQNSIVVNNLLNGMKCYINSSLKLDESAFFRECFSNQQGVIDRAKSFIKLDSACKKCAAFGASVEVLPYSKFRLFFSIGTDEAVDFSKCDEIFNRIITDQSPAIFSINTGNLELDLLLKWLPYQVQNSRFFARAAFYQVGGAIGFRDQLQDCLTMLYIDPSLVRNHILICAAHQFEDGDVQHWWHPPAIGVRTRISDDRLFLPYLVSKYISFTNDHSILSEVVHYLESIELAPNQHSVYAAAKESTRKGSILEHCILAIKSSLNFGENGLMLIGGGDWNDAMDKVGIEGRGTTVWGSMFLYYTINKFLPFVLDADDRALFLDALRSLKVAVRNSWDGEWFLRAFTDDGRKIGSKNSAECRIDLISQSFSVISDIADAEMTTKALDSALSMLVDFDNGIIKLLDPPFSLTEGIGYISDYPKGVRENGGQYTHAAIWFIISLFKAGRIELGYKLLNMINPINHSKNYSDALKYSLEPYVLAADVYAGEHVGRGGWSWYTGAASWMYKCIVENLLGIKIMGNTLEISPNIPAELERIQLDYKTSFGNIHLEIDNKASNYETAHNEIDNEASNYETVHGETDNEATSYEIAHNETDNEATSYETVHNETDNGASNDDSSSLSKGAWCFEVDGESINSNRIEINEGLIGKKIVLKRKRVQS